MNEPHAEEQPGAKRLRRKGHNKLLLDERVKNYQAFIANGNVDQFVLQLTQNPDDVLAVMNIVRDERDTNRRNTVDFVTRLIESAIDRSQIDDQVRSALQWLKDSINRVMLPAGESDRPVRTLITELAPGGSSTIPITIYLSDETIHEQVEAAVEDLLNSTGLRIDSRDAPVLGSWFRRMRANLRNAARSPIGREVAIMAAHTVESRTVLAQDAAVTAKMLENLGPVIAALQPTKDAAIRVGALLIVKVDWVVTVHQLTAAQQLELDHRPQLAASPHEITAALELISAHPNQPAELNHRVD